MGSDGLVCYWVSWDLVLWRGERGGEDIEGEGVALGCRRSREWNLPLTMKSRTYSKVKP